MGYAIPNPAQEYAQMMCGECGIVFTVPEKWRHGRETSGQNFYCPNGHARRYHETVEQTLRKELAAKEQALVWEQQRAESLQKRLKAEAQKRARLDRRVAAGVCPHCQRTFKQLAAHMQSKHQDVIKAAP